MPATIRHISESDAPAYVAFLRQLDAETSFLLWEPGERNTDLEDVRGRIRDQDPAQRVIIVATGGEAILGFLVGTRGARRRIRHRADFTMGVLRRASGRGLGTQLIRAFEAWAREQGIWRLELTVIAGNERAISLYERAGFVREGLKRSSIVVDGGPVDELVMGKLLR